MVTRGQHCAVPRAQTCPLHFAGYRHLAPQHRAADARTHPHRGQACQRRHERANSTEPTGSSAPATGQLPAPSTPTTMAHHPFSDARERPWARLLLNSRRSTGWPVISAMSSKSLSVVPGLGFRPARRSGGPEPMEPCAGRVGRKGCPVLRSLGVRMRVWHRPGASATAVVLRARRASRSRPGCQPQRGCAS